MNGAMSLTNETVSFPVGSGDDDFNRTLGRGRSAAAASLVSGLLGSSPSNLAPLLIHSAIFRHSIFAQRLSPFGHPRVARSTMRRAMSRLLSASPITNSGPFLPPFSIPANVSSRRPPLASFP